MRTLTLLSMLVTAGCLDVKASGGIIFNDHESLLTSRLRPGATNPWLFDDRVDFSWEDAAQFNAVMVGRRAADGRLGANIDPYRKQDEGQAFLYGVNVMPEEDGSIAKRPLYWSGDLASQVLHGGVAHELWCEGTGTARFGDGDEIPSFEDFVTEDLCAGTAIIGAGDTPERVLIVVRVTASAFLYEDGAVTATTLPTEVDPAAVVFADMPASGVVAVVTSQGGALAYARSDVPGSITAQGVAGPLSGFEPIRRDADGRLRLVTTDGLYVWDVEGAGTVNLLATAPAPTIAAAWIEAPSVHGGLVAIETVANELEPSLTVPVAAQIRWEEDNTFVVRDVPPTPCTSSEVCREIGESRLLGVVGEGATRWLAYELWSWWDLRSVWLVPLE